MKAKSINYLKSNLNVLIANNDLKAAKAEIFKCLNGLPLWYPYDPDTFKAELAEDLLSKLKDLKKVKKVSLAEWLRNVPLWYSDEERENFSNNLEMNYEELKSKGLREIEIQKRMKKSLSGMIGNILEKQGKVMELSEKNRLVNDICEKLFDIIGDNKKQKVVKMYEKKIIEWIQDIPMLTAKTSGQKKQNEKFVNTLTARLAILSDLPEEEREKRFEEEIVSSLDDFLEERGQDMAPGAKKKNVAKLMQSITADSSRADIACLVQDEMLKTLAEAGLTPSTSAEKKEFDRITKNSAKQIEELQTQVNNDEDFQELLRNNYNDAIEAILEYKGETLNSKVKNQLVETLMKRYLKTDKVIEKVSEGAKDVQDANNKSFENDVLNFIEAIPELAGMSSVDKKDLNSKMAKRIAQLTEEGYTDEDIAKNLQSEFTDLLQDLGLEVNPETFKNLENSVTRKLSADKARRNSKKSEENLSELEDDVVSNIQKDLVKAFEMIPELASKTPQEKNKVEKICTNLAKKGQMLVTENLSNVKIKEKLKDDMIDAVDEIGKVKPGRNLEYKNKMKAVDQLLNEIVKSVNKTKGRRKSNEKLSNDSLKTFEDIPELTSSAPAKKKELEKLSQKMAKRIEEMKSEAYTDEEIKKKLNDEFGDEISDMPIDAETKETVFDQLLNKAVQSSLKDSMFSPGNHLLLINLIFYYVNIKEQDLR